MTGGPPRPGPAGHVHALPADHRQQPQGVFPWAPGSGRVGGGGAQVLVRGNEASPGIVDQLNALTRRVARPSPTGSTGPPGSAATAPPA
ncbi:hypothetical protein E1292_44330 [Nonomuraea deserti]|uniref:Uncharacterized protein n=1 Tax=Nonomuraea deserti TaxID=1848322 RepID=A0A4R4UL36_9ACTN|nr:hypothetical protein [Nonomuraea deserti]TDC89602.1 hypothetical protein E1292_44330 [Nonomuraea deserti]